MNKAEVLARIDRVKAALAGYDYTVAGDPGELRSVVHATGRTLPAVALGALQDKLQELNVAWRWAVREDERAAEESRLAALLEALRDA